MGIFLHIVGYAVCAMLLAATLRLAKGNVAADGGPVYTRGSAVGAGVWAALLFAWVVYNASACARCSAPWLPPLVSALLALTGCLTLIGPSIRRRWHTPLAVARPFVVALSLPAALLLLEWPYNTSLFSIDAEHMRLNLWLVGAGVLAIWFVLQRRNGSLLFCLAACLVGGLANYFLCLFKGQTILPADVLAISTAAEVSGGYDFVLYDSAAAALCVFLLIAAVLALLPSPRLSRIKAAVNLIIGLAIAASLVNWYETHDIYEDYRHQRGRVGHARLVHALRLHPLLPAAHAGGRGRASRRLRHAVGRGTAGLPRPYMGRERVRPGPRIASGGPCRRHHPGRRRGPQRHRHHERSRLATCRCSRESRAATASRACGTWTGWYRAA